MGLYSHSIGGKRKLADLILHEDKEKIWEKDVFENADTLQCNIFFYCCKFFGLRVHNEFHSLECYQFVAAEDSRGKHISSLVGLPKLPSEDWHIKSFTTNK